MPHVKDNIRQYISGVSDDHIYRDSMKPDIIDLLKKVETFQII